MIGSENDSSKLKYFMYKIFWCLTYLSYFSRDKCQFISTQKDTVYYQHTPTQHYIKIIR